MSRMAIQTSTDQELEIITSVLTPIARNDWFPTRVAEPKPSPDG